MTTLSAPSKVKTDLAFAAKRKPEYQAKVKNSLQIIRMFLSLYPTAAVSVSGGKDSTVLADLVYRVKQVPCVWSDDEFYLPETAEYMARFAKTHDLHQIRTNAVHAPWFRIVGQKWESINHYSGSLGATGVFIGARKDESRQRKWRGQTFGAITTMASYRSSSDFGICQPIQDWTVEDVWTYIGGARLDYNRAYDVMDVHGIDVEQQRIGPYAPAGAYQLALQTLSAVWPEEFERFASRHPEARRYV